MSRPAATPAPPPVLDADLACCVLLCLACGLVDAIGYLGHGVFAANMTGNTVLLGLSLAEGRWGLALDRLLPLLSFFGGALLGRVALNRVGPRRNGLVLGLEAAVLACAVALDPQDPACLALIALAMGVQAVALTRFRNLPVSTVVITSTMARIAEAAADAIRFPAGRPVAAGVSGRTLLVSSWVAYLAGAVTAGVLAPAPRWGFGVAIVLVALAAVITLRSAPPR